MWYVSVTHNYPQRKPTEFLQSWHKAGTTTNLCLLRRRDERVQDRECPGLPRQRNFPEHKLQRQSSETINWTADHLKCFTSQTDRRGLASTQYTVPPTVVGNSHRQEGTNGLENLSAWHRDVLKPDLDHGKDCDTNTLELLWKTKERKTVSTLPQGIISSNMNNNIRQQYHSEGCWRIHREHWTQMPRVGIPG